MILVCRFCIKQKAVYALFLGALFCIIMNACSTCLITEKHSIKKIKETEPYAAVSIQYPDFPRYPVLSQAIENAVLPQYTEFAQSAQDKWNEWNALSHEGTVLSSQKTVPPFEYTVQCKPVYCGDSFISVLITSYSYSGGAHGTTTIRSFYYDTVNNCFKTAAEVTGMSEATIAALCRKVLHQKLQYGNRDADSEKERTRWIANGTEPDEGNFSVFTYDGKKATTYFPHYSVAPYSEGILQVEISPVWE